MRRDLSQAEVTDLIYKHDIRGVRSALKEYLRRKNKVWLLFDNIDKGWSSSGVEPEYLILIRALLDASRKLEQELRTSRIAMHTVVFLSNDVYELLVKQTADRGKEKSVLLDWVDPDLLRELLRRRIVSTGEFGPDASFEYVWGRICVSHVRGEESSQFLIDQC